MDFVSFREKLAASRLEPRVLRTCLALTDVLSKIKPGDGAHLGLPYFYDHIVDESLKEWLIPALSILSSHEGAILDIHGYLDDPEEGQLHLSDEDFHSLLGSGEITHPITGELVKNPLNHVRIFYSLKERVKHVAS